MGAVLRLPLKRFVTVSFNPKDLSNLYSNRRKVSSFYFGRLVESNLALELKKSFYGSQRVSQNSDERF